MDPQKAEGRLWTLWAAFAKAIGLEGSHAGRGGASLSRGGGPPIFHRGGVEREFLGNRWEDGLIEQVRVFV